MNRSIFRHSLLFYTIHWTLIFAVIIVQTEDAVPVQTADLPNSVPENVSVSDSEGELTAKESAVSSDSDEQSTKVYSSIEQIPENSVNTVQGAFVESVSQNSGIVNEITNGGQAVVYTLQDAATAELQSRADIPSTVASQKEPPVDGTNHTEKPGAFIAPENLTTDKRSDEISNATEQTDEIVMIVPLNAEEPKDNLTKAREEIPSFSEWTQKQLEEAEKKKELTNASTATHSVNNKQGSSAKLRSKNYASPDCGAKIVAANPEAISPSSVLSPSRDEYKLNTCTSRIWFIVELCEAVQAKKIDLANFELFSSSPKDFTVSVSDRFPTRDWSIVGQFAAKDERDVQSFDLHPHLFGRYIKVEIKSHYGKEHFCPISLFRVYGTSEFEVLEKENQASASTLDDDDDDETLDTHDGEAPKNLFSSATDAVISIVKKAAEVLGNKGNNSNATLAAVGKENAEKYSTLVSSCTTPSHFVVCDNCSDTLFGNIYELLSCKAKELASIIDNPFVRSTLCFSGICDSFGLSLNGQKTTETQQQCSDYMHAFFSRKYLGAMCNTLAVSENKVVLNNSHQFVNNSDKTSLNTEEETAEIESSEPTIPLDIEITSNLPEIDSSKSTEIPQSSPEIPKNPQDISLTPQSHINPTKVLNDQEDPVSPNSSENTQETEDVNLVHPTEAVKLPQEPTQEAKVDGGEALEKEENLVVDGLSEVDNGTESPESVEEQLDGLTVEFSTDGSQSQSVTPSAVPQKESVFLRLSNRIKVLERNMSLSTQYLEELSQRFKKQVEEIQRLFDKTTTMLQAESKKKDERNQQLEEQIKDLKAVVEALVAERNSWGNIFYWIFLVTAVLFCALTFCRRGPKLPKRSENTEESGEVYRRNSIDVIQEKKANKKKIRRPSEEALKIKGTYEDLLINDGDFGGKMGKKRKKKRGIVRSNSITTLTEETESNLRPNANCDRQNSAANDLDWIERNKMATAAQDVPFVLEESEHTFPEPVNYNCDCSSKKLNGEVEVGDVPVFLRTATDARLNRSSSHNLGVKVDGSKRETHRKTASLDESRKNLVEKANGSAETGVDGDEKVSVKKEKKGFKKIFKKVF